jgi:hypothetical protein
MMIMTRIAIGTLLVLGPRTEARVLGTGYHIIPRPRVRMRMHTHTLTHTRLLSMGIDQEHCYSTAAEYIHRGPKPIYSEGRSRFINP